MYSRLCSLSSMVERSEQKTFIKWAKLNKTESTNLTETQTNVNMWFWASVITKRLCFCQSNLHLEHHDMAAWSKIGDYLNLQLKRSISVWHRFHLTHNNQFPIPDKHVWPWSSQIPIQLTYTSLIPHFKDLLLLHQNILSQPLDQKQPGDPARAAKWSFFMCFELFLAVDLRGEHNCCQDRG